MRINILLSIIGFLFLFGSMQLYAQDEHPHSEEHHFQHHRIAVFTGYGLIAGAINEDGNQQVKVIPVFGFDYEYFINHKFGLGLFNDIELSSYSVEDDHQEYLERNYAFVTSLVFLYEPLIGWSLFAGPGYEFEKHHSFPVIKVGTELVKNFNHGWSMGVAASYEFKEINSSLNIGLTAGKKLGK